MPRINKHDSETLRLRKKAGLTQVEFAAALGVSAATIQSLELNRLKLSEKLRLNMVLASGRDKKKQLRMIEERVTAYRKKLMRFVK